MTKYDDLPFIRMTSSTGGRFIEWIMGLLNGINFHKSDRRYDEVGEPRKICPFYIK